MKGEFTTPVGDSFLRFELLWKLLAVWGLRPKSDNCSWQGETGIAEHRPRDNGVRTFSSLAGWFAARV